MPKRLIGLAVVLAVSLTLAPHTAEAQQAGKVYRKRREIAEFAAKHRLPAVY